jgi:hypothetical protein
MSEKQRERVEIPLRQPEGVESFLAGFREILMGLPLGTYTFTIRIDEGLRLGVPDFFPRASDFPLCSSS